MILGSEASKYYGELRAREDYMARRQVDLERHLMRLLQQAGWGGSVEVMIDGYGFSSY